MTDFHSHILPRMDDGSPGAEETLSMLQASAMQGVSLIAATPHFYATDETLSDFLSRRDSSYGILADYTDLTVLPRILLGAEVHFYDGISHTEELYKLALQGTSLILLEMPFGIWTTRMLNEVENIKVKTGLTPVIAHLEKYCSPYSLWKMLRRVYEVGAFPQISAFYLTTLNGIIFAKKCYKNETGFIIGSDTHNLTSRPQNIGNAFKKLTNVLGQQKATSLFSFTDEVIRYYQQQGSMVDGNATII